MNIYETDIEIGDYIEVMIINKKGDRNLDGNILKGEVVKLSPEYKQIELKSGWCCHSKDKLLLHKKVGENGITK